MFHFKVELLKSHVPADNDRVRIFGDILKISMIGMQYKLTVPNQRIYKFTTPKYTISFFPNSRPTKLSLTKTFTYKSNGVFDPFDGLKKTTTYPEIGHIRV